MRILAVETSCDETAVALVENGTTVHATVIATSKAAFEKLAGVIPEEAARHQIECIIPSLREALDGTESSWDGIDAIAVTKGPGLLGSLLVGTTTARVLAWTLNKPLIGVHHTLGHLSSTWLHGSTPLTMTAPLFPILTLSASGGHTDLWYRTSHTKGTLLGRTRDDAAGEAFDKGASLLGLPYPGGPSIAQAADQGDANAFIFPSPLHADDTFDFSFSGLKTSLKYLLRDDPSAQKNINDVAASYQHALCSHLTSRIILALEKYSDVCEVHLVGGVSANRYLRSMLEKLCEDHASKVIVRFPSSLSYCTDNAAMIGAAGYFLFHELGEKAFDPFLTQATLPLEETIDASLACTTND